MDRTTGQTILRGGQLRNLDHDQFFIDDIDDPGIKAEIIATYKKHPKMPPIIEYKKVKKAGQGTAERVVVTGIRSDRE